MKKYIIYAIVGILIAFVIITIYLKFRFSGYDLVTPKSNFSIKISKISKYRGSSYINDSLMIEPVFTDDRKTDKWFSEIITIGDSLIKDKSKDYLVLIKGNQFLTFPLVRNMKEY